MTLDQLRDTREKVPFQPFTVHLADGRSMRVPHRDYVSMSPGGRTVIIYGKAGRFNIVDSYLITDLEFGKARLPTSDNGPDK